MIKWEIVSPEKPVNQEYVDTYGINYDNVWYLWWEYGCLDLHWNYYVSVDIALRFMEEYLNPNRIEDNPFEIAHKCFKEAVSEGIK